jgi:hypothetical protein
MANPFAKSRPVGQPYAIYRAGDMTWHVCKTYKAPPMRPRTTTPAGSFGQNRP